jgi:hypothetical protein
MHSLLVGRFPVIVGCWSKQAHIVVFSNISVIWQVACVLMFYLQKDDFPVDTHVRENSFVIYHCRI